ncbi:hypothetical protein [Chitinophaga arvensicola]|uniref:Uncharacterized protein n=1 Tax=Chitinophaga arvensicola TaxID=29529 RepID=A0A1I0PE19_9BACT|nr:hypothetical protein [Chitinophaga arvensicola]SEW12662.1 hypothetical protein SAMN04488122_0734 [Chitinophaga arvensicola]
MIRKAFTGLAVCLLIAGVAMAQEKTKTAAKSKKEDAACKTTAKGKSCCQQPSKTASLRMAAANKTKAKAQ